MKELSVKQTTELLLTIAKKIQSKREILGDIDRKIGDGDHGEGMYEGFSKVETELTAKKYTTLSALFKDVGNTLIFSMGGASGVLFGSLFRGIAQSITNEHELTVQDIYSGSLAALEEIKKKGNVESGDKTMVDALSPAVLSMKTCVESGKENLLEFFQQARINAVKGVEATKKMVAKKGRAKSLGNRTLGLQDAGATSIMYIFEAMEDYCREEVEKSE